MVGVLNEYVRLAGYAHDDVGSTPNLVSLSDWLARTPMGRSTSATAAPIVNWLR